ncbi:MULTISPECIES: hypothetical protein [unclassified Roseovarius]|uniref:hypothetical protein n=1 Tax=unclassified Roseovarius TaxID=2614913 RepID=UPI00273D579E|nr:MULTISPECIES: hypothetical protein [unclassified Roseovarius]
MGRLTSVIAMLAASNAVAQEACIEPVRPDAGYLSDAGYGAREIRSAFRGYFSDVEDYLNCLNQASGRIRQEATAAAQDYDRVLDQYPAESGQGGDPERAPRIEMTDSGTLFLDYQAGWLK